MAPVPSGRDRPAIACKAVDALAAFLEFDDDSPPAECAPDYAPPELTEEYVAALRQDMDAAADDDEPHGVLQLPIAPAWYEDAACADMDTEAFHDSSPDAVAAAKAVCADCPAIAQCRDLAVTDPQLFGVWGGQTEKERAVARRQGAPVKRRARREHARGRQGLQPCGTPAGYRRHRRAGEDACDACKAAHREKSRRAA